MTTILRTLGWVWLVLSAFAVVCLYLISSDGMPLVGGIVVSVTALSPGIAAIVSARILDRRHLRGYERRSNRKAAGEGVRQRR